MTDKSFKGKRISLGLLAMIGVSIVMDFVPNPFAGSIPPDRFSYFVPLPGTWSALETAVAACVGAYIARVEFAAAAALLTTAAALIAVRILQHIAEPVQPVAFVELLARNSVGTAVAILGAVIGAEIGLWLVQRNVESGTEAA